MFPEPGIGFGHGLVPGNALVLLNRELGCGFFQLGCSQRESLGHAAKKLRRFRVILARLVSGRRSRQCAHTFDVAGVRRERRRRAPNEEAEDGRSHVSATATEP